MTHEEFDSIAALDAIGATTAEEAAALHVHIEGCADCRQARDEYAEAATLMALDLPPVDPPAQVRERIVPSIAPERHFHINPWWLATAATLFLALWGWRELGIRAAREKMRSQDAEIRRLSEERDRLAAQNERLSSIAAPGTQVIALAGREMSPSASARVFMDSRKHRAIVFFSNMPANPSDKSYQLWIIRADQPKPQSAGVFDVAANGSATISVENLPVMTEIKALAVTMEPRGGAPQPTSGKFYVMGGTS